MIPIAHAGTLIPDLNATTSLAQIGAVSNPLFADLLPLVLFVLGFIVVAFIIRFIIGAFHR